MNRNIENNSVEYGFTLTEIDFVTPYDDRIHNPGIEDIAYGDSYDEYVKEFWELYEEELFDCAN